MISILTGVAAGLGIEAVGLFGAAGGSSLLFRFVRLIPSIIRLAEAVRDRGDDPVLKQDADRIIKDLERK